MSLFQGLAEIAGGIFGRGAAKMQEQAAKLEMRMARIRETQIAAEYRGDLASTLQSIEAIRAGRNVSGDSQTASDIRGTTIRDMLRSEAVARLAEVNRAEAARMAAAGYAYQARWAIPMAGMRALAVMSGDAAKAASAMMGGPAGGGGHTTTNGGG